MITNEASPPTFLRLLSELERDSLLARGRSKRWQRGDVLVRRGDPADSAIVVLAGLVKVHATAVEGAEVVLGFSGPGDLVGESSAVAGARRLATVSAIDEVDGVEIAVSHLRAFLTDHPRVMLTLLELALGRLYVSDARRMEFATSESLARVAARLIELAERFGERRDNGAIEILLPITQDELASWSASSRESTGRSLRTLRNLGLIETARRRLIVIDLERLRSHAPRI